MNYPGVQQKFRKKKCGHVRPHERFLRLQFIEWSVCNRSRIQVTAVAFMHKTQTQVKQDLFLMKYDEYLP
jgi:hypothetical protein